MAVADISVATPGAAALGLSACIALVVGNMIGSGVFLLPLALAQFGPISIGGWLVTSTGAVLLALVFGRLARQCPRPAAPMPVLALSDLRRWGGRGLLRLSPAPGRGAGVRRDQVTPVRKSGVLAGSSF